MPAAVLGLDIGGANLKAGHSSGLSSYRSFPLWKNPAGLKDALGEILRGAPPSDLLAVTMTGELCDCYTSKREGVNAILDAVEAVAGKTPVLIWQNDGRFVDVAAARAAPLKTASANWLALATWAGRLAPSGAALLIDIGSTTTDINPLQDGKPIPKGRTDPDRLKSQELVYTGIRRTPLCAILAGEAAAELFATTLDAYLILEMIRDNPSDCDTADGRPATAAHAHARLARMMCADLETSTKVERQKLAERVLLKQVYCLRLAVQSVQKRLAGPLETVIVSGSGESLAGIVIKEMGLAPKRLISLADILKQELSIIAPAYALAVLGQEHRNAG